MKAKLIRESLYESDHQENEGAHYKAQLEEIVEMAEKIYSELPEGNVPAWVGDKIVVAKEYMYAVKSWLHCQEEKEEGEELGANREMDDDDEDHEDFGDAPDMVATDVMVDPEDELDGDDVILDFKETI